MYRSTEDIALLTELAGVLDQTVADAGLSSGTYLVLRDLARRDGPVGIGALAKSVGAPADEVAELAGRLVDDDFLIIRGGGLEISRIGTARLNDLESSANEAMRSYVMDRPHTATVYGLVASMQSGRFTVEDLIEFINEGPTEE